MSDLIDAGNLKERYFVVELKMFMSGVCVQILIFKVTLFVSLISGVAFAQNSMGVTAEQLWADQQCGGNAAYKKDEKKFNACVEAKLKTKRAATVTPSDNPMAISAEQLWAEQQCGGIAAYKKDEKKFNACVEEKLKTKRATTVTPGDIWTDKLCGGGDSFKANEKKFNACKEAFKQCGFDTGVKLTKAKEDCVAKAMVSHCPVYSPPLCEKNQRLGSILEEGCGTPVCVDSNNCPVFSPPACGANAQIAMIPTGDGCRKPICVQKESRGGNGGVR